MPRDLQAERALNDMPPLDRLGGDPPSGLDIAGDSGDRIQHDMQQSGKRDQLHPYIQTLTLSDVENCVKLEEQAFAPHERCTREKFIYRLTKCGELCLGIFTSAGPDSTEREAATAETARPATSHDPENASVLLGHIVVTKTTNEVVTDDDMALPPKWQEEPHAAPHLGHKEEGRVICIHSLAVLPEYQGLGLGTTLMKAYEDRIQDSQVADRLALIAHDHLTGYYEKLGFRQLGPSKAQFGGGGWCDFVMELRKKSDSDGSD